MPEGDPKFAADDSPLTWRDQRDMSRVSASVRQNLTKFNQRPNPPRGVRFNGGILQWEAPQYSEQITHYRIYAPTEDTLVREVPSGQLRVNDGLTATRVFVSAINRNSGLESIKVLLDAPVAAAPATLLIITDDARRVSDGAITSGTAILSSATAAFSSGRDVGKAIAVVGAGAVGVLLTGTILSVTNSTTVVLSGNAGTTMAGAIAVWGTDNTPLIQAAISGVTDGLSIDLTLTGSANAQATASFLTIGTLAVSLRKLVIALGPTAWYLCATMATVTSSTPAFKPVLDGGSLSLIGSGANCTNLYWLATGGKMIDLTTVFLCTFKDFSATALAPSNTAEAFYLNNCSVSRLDSFRLQSFAKCVELAGTSNTLHRGFSFWLHNLEFQDYTTFGLWTYHTVGLNIDQLYAYATANFNPSLAWGIIFDTDTYSVNMNHVDVVFGGILFRHSLPENVTFGGPPSYFFGSQVVADSTSTKAMLFDASIAPAGDPQGRAAVQLRFVDSWAGFTQTDGDSGITIRGGDSISFIGITSRLNRRHGMEITGGNNIRITDPLCIGNNVQNAAGGCGIYIGAGAGSVEIIGGRCGDGVAGDTGHQHYGIQKAVGAGDPLTIMGTDLQSNVTAPFSYLGSGLLTYWAAQEGAHGGGTFSNNLLSVDKGRIALGDDGLFYLDYLFDLANTVRLVMGSGYSLNFERSSNTFSLWMNSLNTLRFILGIGGSGAGPGKSVSILNRPTIAAGLENQLLNSALDSYSAERFGLTGLGKMTWGPDGATITHILELLAGLLQFSGNVQFNNTFKAFGDSRFVSALLGIRGVDYLWPAADGAGSLTSDGIGNLAWAAAGSLPVVDTTAIVKGSGDATKKVRIEADGLTTGTTRVATMPDRDITLNQLENLSATASGSLTLSTTMTDVTGMTVTLNKNGTWLILVNVTFTADALSTGVQAQLVIAGSPYGAVMQSDALGTYDKSRSWLYTNSGSNVAKVQAKKNAGAGVSTAFSGSSDITATFIG